MEQPKTDVPKLPDMVMCGDHPSFTKTELNVKDSKPDEKKAVSKISPTTSRTERAAAVIAGSGEVRRMSEHAMRGPMGALGGFGGLGGLGEARRRVRPFDHPDNDIATGNRALVQAALGSFRWPPYLLGVWVVVLILTHILHCVVTMLERTLPNIRRFCQYFRSWAEEAWRADAAAGRAHPVLLALAAGLLYTLYFCLYVVYSVALWAVEPLCGDLDDKSSATDIGDVKVTNYIDEIGSKTNMKH